MLIRLLKLIDAPGLNCATSRWVRGAINFRDLSGLSLSPGVFMHRSEKSADEFARNGRIFLDYLGNDRMATAVAPLSDRARAGATVSMPVSWTQVQAELDTKGFAIRTTPRLLAKSTAWKDYCNALRPVEPAIKKLSKVKQAA